MSALSLQVLAAPDMAKNNRTSLAKAGKAACYGCCETFPAHKVTEWTDGQQTAVCPLCGVDSVIPVTPELALTPEVLQEMNQFWFARPVHWKLRDKTPSFFAELA